jgi:2-polyprenyl-6-methoxyphenol hydroxylase-like FAD-dependent oxidoreductase
MGTEFDAIIVGAGPAGSSAAILLARAGWSVALVEKQRFPRRKVCGECIAASNLPLLDALGIGPAFDTIAGPELRKVALMRRDQQIVANLPPAAHHRYRWGRALGREALDTLLLEKARSVGAHIVQPWSVQAIGGAAGDWRCVIHDMDSSSTLTLKAPVVIAALGSWEALPADRLRRRPPRAGSDLFAFKANFRDASLAEGLLPVLSFIGGYGGMVVADSGITTVACCIRRDHVEACRRASPGSTAGDSIEALLSRECEGVRRALHTAWREGPWLAVGPLAPGIRLCEHDALFRIGNAAGEAHPIIGEGMSMALQSAWLLCTQLLGAERRGATTGAAWQREVGRRYATAWHQQFEPRLRVAAAFAHMAMRPTCAVALMALARVWPGVLTLGAKWGGKVRCAVDPAMIASLAAASPQARESSDESTGGSRPQPTAQAIALQQQRT